MIAQVLKPFTDYDSFTYTNVNRDVSPAHVDHLAESARVTNLLDLYPIVAQTPYLALDGQHRTKLGKLLRLAVYVLVGNDITVDDVAHANANTRPYSVADVLHVYSRAGIEPYKYFADYLAETGGAEDASRVAWLRQLFDPSSTAASFLDGEFTIKRPEYARLVDSRVRDLNKFTPDKGKGRNWVLTSPYRDVMAQLTLDPEYDHAHMLERIAAHPTRFVPCKKVAEAYPVLDYIYNYDNRGGRKKHRLLPLLPGMPTRSFDQGFTPIVRTVPPAARSVSPDWVVLVHKTEDTSHFTIHPDARPVNALQMTQMVEAMKRKPLLHYYPIIVDGKMTVLDGQRRLMAARALKLPVFYIVAKDANLLMMVGSGTRSLSWKLNDYLKHFCELGNQHYQQLRAFRQRFPFIGLRNAYIALQGSMGWEKMDSLYKTGEFQVNQPRFAENFALCLSGVNDEALRRDSTFQRNLMMQLYHPNFDSAHMIAQINLHPDKMHPYSNMEGCMARMEETYNAGRGRGRPPATRFIFSKIPPDMQHSRLDAPVSIDGRLPLDYRTT